MGGFFCKSISLKPSYNSLDIRHIEDNATVYYNNQEKGTGCLMVKESSLTWWSESSQIGFELDYPLIMCHAICSDNLSFMPTPCLFCQLDSEGTYEFFNSTFDDSENNTHELIIVPENKDSLQNIFEAISACQPLHPVKEENATLFSQEEHIINHINPFFQVPDTSQIELDALDEEGKYDDAD